MEAMGIPPDTPSLLFTLLESYEREPHQDPTIQARIIEVVNAVKLPRPFRSNLIKDIAQRKLYEVLYDTIEKAYEDPHQEPTSDTVTLEAREKARILNLTLNSAIGGALEIAMEGRYRDLPAVRKLYDELRKEIIEALTPKPAE